MKREFVINRHGKDYVLYAGLLDEAHQQGLRSIKTELVQVPSAQNGNVAICMAEVTTERGSFAGIGDADPSNVNRMMVNALIRLAETRAKARALRDAVNVAMVAIEELSESAPEMLLLDEPDEPPRLAAAAPSEAPAPIVSLSSVRQSAQSAAGGLAPHVVAESAGATATVGAAAAGATAPATAGAAEPVRLPVARPAARGASNGPPKAAPDGPPLPATPTQLETIAKLARSVGRAVPTEGLTRAAASELITRLSEERYGARRTP
jgi:hypothetical protein